jgi:Signal transduction histidine kinase
MWVGGIFLLVIYSGVLFWLLQKYFNELQQKYRILLRATGEIAKGNLDVEITEDLGIFSPFKQEIQKIQTGFKKAVDEEVKSQRMKTELITNVSHDLKTPLTAIITYVNLLKDEKDEEKRKDYIEVLERKSLRLKVLIEDLFEVSKASSKNVTLNIVDVDVVNLFKQVKLELEDKIAAADLDFRCTYPDEKVSALLDSQKTYRVFENLLVNIVKYAMPHTRVYIEIAREGEEAVIRMKNVSALELNFNTEEITERFVRGDASRNTEGSGLGLAIVKNFVELQKGKFKIETEADLFKVEVRF